LLRKRWWLILLIVLVGAGSAAYFNATIREAPIYRSTVTLLLNPALGQGALVSSSLSERTNQLAVTYSRYLKTQAFADIVIKREGLTISPRQLVQSIDARILEGISFFEINAIANTPQDAQLLATVIANNFIAQNLAQQREQQAARRVANTDDMQMVLREKLERERQYYEERVTALREQIAQISTQPASAARDATLVDIQEQLSQYEDRLLKTMTQQVALQPASANEDINTVSVIQPASLPDAPINQTNKVRNLLFAGLASLLVGVALAFLLEYMDYTVKSPEELEEAYSKPVLGVFNRLPTRQNGDGAESLVALEKEHSALGEAFRVLRTNLSFSSAGRQWRSLVITSAGPGEGKTFVAANLAVVMAQAGKRVILVDCDLRRPAVHQRFSMARTPGFGDLLLAEDAAQPETFRPYLQAGPVEGLRILTCGITTPNPSELLSFEHTQRLLDALEADADIVIYDTPPALTVTDAVVLSARSQAVVQVVQAGSTRRDLVLKVRDILQRVNDSVLGPVLNRVEQQDVGYYYYYYYYSQYYKSNKSDDGTGEKKKGRREKGRRVLGLGQP
jgi:non-specific protein-tyrosine kinase